MSDLLEKLRSSDPDTSWSAARKLAETGAEDAARELVRQLGNEQKNYSAMAVSVQYPEETDARIGAYAHALVEIGDPSVVPELIELLDHESAWVVWEAAYVLEALDAREAVPALIEALERLRGAAGRYRFEFMIRRDVAGSILGLADESAVPALQDVLKDESDGRMISLLTRGISELDAALTEDEHLLEALETGSLPEKVFALELILGRDEEHPLDNTSGIRDALIAVVDSDCALHYRRSAVHLLGELRASEAIPDLLERLDTRPLRPAILEAVEKIPDGLELLADRMELDDDEASLSAAVRLGQEGDARATPFLKRALRGGEAGDRLEAATALAGLGEREPAIEILVDLVESPSAELHHRKAVRSLGELQAEEAVSALVSAGDGGAPSVQIEAARALCRLAEGETATEILSRWLESTMWRSEAVDVIRTFTPPAAIPLLVESLTDIDDDHLDSAGGPAEFHRDVLDALRAYPSYPEMVVEALDHEDDDVRFWAAIHLGREGDDGVSPILEEALESDRDNVRLEAVRSLYALDERETADAGVAEILESDVPGSLRARTIDTLVEFERTGFIPELERIVEDDDEYADVRLDAAVALYRLGERERSVRTLERFLEDAGRFFLTDVLEALRETDATSLVPAVRRAAECWYQPAKVEAVRTLVHFDAGEAALEVVSEVLSESYMEVRTKTDVIDALANLEEPSAVDAIPEVEKLTRAEEDPRRRRALEEAIQRLRSETRPT